MPQQPTPKEKVYELRRLVKEGFLSKTAIAKRVKVDYRTLMKYTADIKGKPTKAELIEKDALSKKYKRKELAAKHGITENGLYFYLRKIGLVKETKKPLTPKQIKEIKERAKLGEEYATIAEDYGRTSSCIGSMLRKAGINRNNTSKVTINNGFKDQREVERPVRVKCPRCTYDEYEDLNKYEWSYDNRVFYRNCKTHCEVTPTHLDICGIESTFKMCEDFSI